MNTLAVDLGERSYPVVLGGIAEWLDILLEKISHRSVLIVTDDGVPAEYSDIIVIIII